MFWSKFGNFLWCVSEFTVWDLWIKTSDKTNLVCPIEMQFTIRSKHVLKLWTCSKNYIRNTVRRAWKHKSDGVWHQRRKTNVVRSGPGLGGGGTRLRCRQEWGWEAGWQVSHRLLFWLQVVGCRRTFRSCLKAEKGTLGKEREGFLTFGKFSRF